jgi:acyl-CoA reductase-like NAD-dependent aldehyde dehydrogenase
VVNEVTSTTNARRNVSENLRYRRTHLACLACLAHRFPFHGSLAFQWTAARNRATVRTPRGEQRLAALPEKEQEEKIERAKRKAMSALDGAAKLERAEIRAADEARVRALTALFNEMSKLRHDTAVVKVPAVIDFVRDAIEASGKVVLFAHHKDVVQAIRPSRLAKPP